MAYQKNSNQPQLPSRRKNLAVLAAGASLCVTGGGAWAQSPSRNYVRLVTSGDPGSLGDQIARVLAERLQAQGGQTVVVENRPGAGGNLATDQVARAPADGGTLLVTADSMMVVNPFIYSKLPFDPEKDFQSVSLLGKTDLVLVTTPSSGIKSVEQLRELAKAKPAELYYASGGNGHPTHLAMELTANRLGIKVTHVPYKGMVAALQGLISGDTTVMLVGLIQALPHMKAGRIVGLATTGPTAKKVLPELPELKTFHDDLDISVWIGLWAPAGVPKETLRVLNAEVAQALAHPELAKRVEGVGLTPISSTPEELDALMAQDRERFGRLAKQLGLKID